jgi:hypothetical protein
MKLPWRKRTKPEPPPEVCRVLIWAKQLNPLGFEGHCYLADRIIEFGISKQCHFNHSKVLAMIVAHELGHLNTTSKFNIRSKMWFELRAWIWAFNHLPQSSIDWKFFDFCINGYLDFSNQHDLDAQSIQDIKLIFGGIK